jgi:hypothetical protein
MALFTYLLQDVLSQNVLGTVNLSGVTFNSPVNTAGTFTGTFTLERTGNPVLDVAEADFAQLAFCPDQTLIHCIWPETNAIVASYLLISANWDPSQNQLALNGTQMSAWLSECYPENMTLPYSPTNVDQFTVAQELINQLVQMGPGNGIPPIYTGNALSGITTTLSVTSSYQQDLNSLITQVSQNYDGFDWDIHAVWGTKNVPELALGLYFPEKSSGVPGSGIDLFFYSTKHGSNLTGYWPWPCDASYRYNEIIMTATNTAGQDFTATWLDGRFGASAITPQETGGETVGFTNTFTPLRRTYVGSAITNNYSANTLGALSAVMGTSWSQSDGAPVITHIPSNPSIGSYNVGDRCRIAISDPYLDFDITNVRIVDRAITDEDPNTVASVAVTLDLTDTNNPADNA